MTGIVLNETRLLLDASSADHHLQYETAEVEEAVKLRETFERAMDAMDAQLAIPSTTPSLPPPVDNEHPSDAANETISLLAVFDTFIEQLLKIIVETYPVGIEVASGNDTEGMEKKKSQSMLLTSIRQFLLQTIMSMSAFPSGTTLAAVSSGINGGGRGVTTFNNMKMLIPKKMIAGANDSTSARPNPGNMSSSNSGAKYIAPSPLLPRMASGSGSPRVFASSRTGGGSVTFMIPSEPSPSELPEGGIRYDPAAAASPSPLVSWTNGTTPVTLDAITAGPP